MRARSRGTSAATSAGGLESEPTGLSSGPSPLVRWPRSSERRPRRALREGGSARRGDRARLGAATRRLVVDDVEVGDDVHVELRVGAVEDVAALAVGLQAQRLVVVAERDVDDAEDRVRERRVEPG